MINLNYSIWLQEALGAGAKLSRIFSVFHSAEEIYNAAQTGPFGELELSGVFSEKQMERLISTPIENSYGVLKDCAEMGIDILLPDSAQYPRQLFNLEDYPLVLYVKGNLSCLDDKIPLSIVGTRKPSDYSRGATRLLSKQLSSSGFIIISGGALGIDTAAHTGAILAGGKTIAVLGCGIGARYLKENKALRNVIAENGALISEHPPRTLPYKGSFPIRNRLIAALSCGTVVAEAGIKSGSLITATQAANLGRDIFVIPGLAVIGANQGSEELIRDGATEATCALDIVLAYVQRYPELFEFKDKVDLSEKFAHAKSTLHKLETDNDVLEAHPVDYDAECNIMSSKKNGKAKRKLAESISKEAQEVYACFGDTPLSIDDVVETVMIPTNSVLGALTELEIFGYIELLPDTKYFLK